MPTVLVVLVSAQALGALVGAGAAVLGEIAYAHAMKDGRIDDAERRHLVHYGAGLRFGLMLVLLGSFGLVLEAYLAHSSVQPALTAEYWILIALSVLIILVSWALAQRRFSFALGSAALFTAWWFLAYLALGFLPGITFGAAVALFVVATAVFYGILWYSRTLILPPVV